MDTTTARVIIFVAAIAGSAWFLLDTIDSFDKLDYFQYIPHLLTCVAGLVASCTIAVGAGILLWDGDPKVLKIGTYIMIGTLVAFIFRFIYWWDRFNFEVAVYLVDWGTKFLRRMLRLLQ